MSHANERPILFSGAMVCAILSGQKTVTRRVVREQPPEWTPEDAVGRCADDGRWEIVSTGIGPREHLENGWSGEKLLPYTIYMHGFRCPYGAPGDRLWVRETWYDDAPGDNDPKKVDYRATHDCRSWEAGCACHGDGGGSLWRPSIHMPRIASRLTLAVTDVRVERLHAITPEDAQREGVEHYWHALNESDARTFGNRWTEYAVRYGYEKTAPDWRGAFASLWDQINGKRAPWASNPWVWRVAFARVTP